MNFHSNRAFTSSRYSISWMSGHAWLTCDHTSLFSKVKSVHKSFEFHWHTCCDVNAVNISVEQLFKMVVFISEPWNMEAVRNLNWNWTIVHVYGSPSTDDIFYCYDEMIKIKFIRFPLQVILKIVRTHGNTLTTPGFSLDHLSQRRTSHFPWTPVDRRFSSVNQRSSQTPYLGRKTLLFRIFLFPYVFIFEFSKSVERFVAKET